MRDTFAIQVQTVLRDDDGSGEKFGPVMNIAAHHVVTIHDTAFGTTLVGLSNGRNIEIRGTREAFLQLTKKYAVLSEVK